MKKVLITGMSGLIGGLLGKHLERVGGYELSALNRRSVEGVKCFQADISDLEAIRPAFVGQEVVVHLAAQVQDEPLDGLVRANLIGMYNVYEAARQAGVRRVVFGSSGATSRGLELEAPYDAVSSGRQEDMPETWSMVTADVIRPNGTYAASKVWGEALGRYYSDYQGMSVLCVRIGSVTAENRPSGVEARSRFTSHRDICQVLHRCIDAPDDLKYDVFYAASKNKWGYRDLEHPRQVLGYEPEDSAEDMV